MYRVRLEGGYFKEAIEGTCQGAPNTRAVLKAGWNCDGSILASSADGVVRLWSVHRGEGTLAGTLDPGVRDPKNISAMQWHPTNPHLLATGAEDTFIRFWDARVGGGSSSCSGGGSGGGSGVLGGPGGGGSGIKQGGSGGLSASARPAAGGVVGQRSVTQVGEKKLGIINLAWRPDGNVVMVGDRKDRFFAIDVRKPNAPLTSRRMLHADHEVDDIVFTPNGRYLLMAAHNAFGENGLIEAWKCSPEGNLGPRVESALAHRGVCTCIAMDRDGRYVATAGHEGLVCQWQLDGLICVRSMDLADKDEQSFEEKERLALQGSGEAPPKLSAGGPAKSICFSHDSRFLAAGTESGLVEVFDTASGARAAQWRVGQAANNVVAFHPQQHLLAVGSNARDNPYGVRLISFRVAGGGGSGGSGRNGGSGGNGGGGNGGGASGGASGSLAGVSGGVPGGGGGSSGGGNHRSGIGSGSGIVGDTLANGDLNHRAAARRPR